MLREIVETKRDVSACDGARVRAISCSCSKGEELGDDIERAGCSRSATWPRCSHRSGKRSSRRTCMGSSTATSGSRTFPLRLARRDVAFTAKVLDFGIATLVAENHHTGVPRPFSDAYERHPLTEDTCKFRAGSSATSPLSTSQTRSSTAWTSRSRFLLSRRYQDWSRRPHTAVRGTPGSTRTWCRLPRCMRHRSMAANPDIHAR